MIDELRFKVSELYTDRGAYNSARYLLNFIRYNSKNVIAVSEGIKIEPEEEKSGGIILFSEEANAEVLNDNKLVNWFRQKFETLKNKIVDEHALAGWSIGRFLDGRYNIKNGKTYGEKSLSVEIIGVNSDELIRIAAVLCIEFLQESVLVKDYSNNRAAFVEV